MLDIKKTTEDKRIIYSLEGRLDTTTSPDLEKEVEAVPADTRELVFDFEKLEYISSAGLRVILRLRKEEPKLAIINVAPDVYEVFDMTGFTDMVTVEKARIQGTLAIVKFYEVADRNEAEDLREAEVFVDEEDLEELPDDTYYVRDLEGLRVIDDDTGEEVGEIAEVIRNAAQDVYRIALAAKDVLAAEDALAAEAAGEIAVENTAQREALVPAVKEFIKDVDIEAGTIRIHFIEGMK